jgi:hypothetical protein
MQIVNLGQQPGKYDGWANLANQMQVSNDMQKLQQWLMGQIQPDLSQQLASTGGRNVVQNMPTTSVLGQFGRGGMMPMPVQMPAGQQGVDGRIAGANPQDAVQRIMGGAPSVQQGMQNAMGGGQVPQNLPQSVSMAGGGNLAQAMGQQQQPQQQRQNPMPMMTTPQGQALAAQILQKQMQSPLEQSQTEYYKNRVNNPTATALSSRSKTIKGADGNYYQFNPETGEYEQTDIGVGSASGNVITKNIVGEDGKMHTYQIDKITGEKKADLGVSQKLGTTSSTERKEIGDLMTLRDNVDIIESLYDKKYVGMVQGNAGLSTAKEVTGIGVDVEGTQFRRLVNDLADRLLRARSGAQINNEEYKRLRKLVPTTDLSEVAFNAKLKDFKNELDRTLATKKSVIESSGLKSPDTGTDTPTIGSDSDYDSLEPGQQFYDPNGILRRKP